MATDLADGPKVPSDAIPQANSLESIRRLLQAVADGATSTAAIGQAANLRPRDVRYYLLATQTINLIALEMMVPKLTAAGERLLDLKAKSLQECDAIAFAISDSCPLRAAVGDFLHESEIDQKTLRDRLWRSTDLSPSTASRRAECLMAWRSQLRDRGWTPAGMAARAAPPLASIPSDDVSGSAFEELSVRAGHVLEALGITTIADLAGTPPGAFIKTRNCGRKTAREILSWAKSHNWPLKDEIDPSIDGNSAPPPPPINSADMLPTEMLLNVSDFNPSVRASNYLKQAGIQRIGDLVPFTTKKLLGGKNCGRKTVRELQDIVTSLGFQLGMNIPIWEALDADALAHEREAALALIRSGLAKRMYAVDSSAGVETEIASALVKVVKPANLPKVQLWIGLDQVASPTLQDVADVANVTRERIRQIVEGVQIRIRKAQLEMPRLRAVITHLEQAAVVSEGSAHALLAAEGLVDGRISLRGILRAAELFGVQHKLDHERLDGHGFVGTAGRLEILPAIRQLARRAVEHWGCSTVDDVLADVKGNGHTGATPELIRDALTIQPGFHWLDEDVSWFWFNDLPRNRLLNKIDKILAVCKKIDLHTLRAGIGRHYRMEGFAPPTRVLRALCGQLDDCKIVGGEIVVDTRPRDAEIELSDQEKAMVEVFGKNGPVLSYTKTCDLCAEAGLNETTTSIYLANSPILQRVALGVYTIIGATVKPGDVAAASKTSARRKRRVIQDYGWQPDGAALWVTYKISAGFLRSGVTGVPGGIKKYLHSEGYELQGKDGTRIGRLGIGGGNMWGFLPFFKRRGGEIGDHLRVTFNTEQRLARIELSQEAFDDADPDE